MDQIPDDIFSKNVLGICCGIDPSEWKVVDGKLHAVGIGSAEMKIQIHVGIDTVNMNGDGFSNMVKLNQTAKKGELLLTMDLEKISEAGHPTTIILTVTNSDDFEPVTEIAISYRSKNRNHLLPAQQQGGLVQGRQSLSAPDSVHAAV